MIIHTHLQKLMKMLLLARLFQNHISWNTIKYVCVCVCVCFSGDEIKEINVMKLFPDLVVTVYKCAEERNWEVKG